MFFNFHKPEKFKMELCIFLFISLANIVMVSFAVPLSKIGYRTWAFFFVNISYFMLHEADMKRKFCKLAFGATFGCLLAFMTEWLSINVLHHMFGHYGIILPITFSLACVILVGPIMPMFFNAVTFLYFAASLIVGADAIGNVGPNILFALLGVLVLDGGCYLIIRHFEKKKKQ